MHGENKLSKEECFTPSGSFTRKIVEGGDPRFMKLNFLMIMVWGGIK